MDAVRAVVRQAHARELLAVAAEEGRRLECPWGVMSFEPHPRSFFRPDEPVFRLTPAALKARLSGGSSQEG